MTDSEVKDMIVSAWKNARKNAPPASNQAKGYVHRKRSEVWVNALAEKLVELYERDPGDIRVFWRGQKDSDFILNELLFDVAVCELEETRSIDKGKPLPFVNKCLWLVESELQTDNSRPIIVDLSKLVMGSSERKLFVAGLSLGELKKDSGDRRKGEVLKMCKKAAARCGEPFYFCFIPHPKAWNELDVDEYGPSIWLLHEGEWQPILQ